jgi:hypothetical protein
MAKRYAMVGQAEIVAVAKSCNTGTVLNLRDGQYRLSGIDGVNTNGDTSASLAGFLKGKRAAKLTRRIVHDEGAGIETRTFQDVSLNGIAAAISHGAEEVPEPVKPVAETVEA